MSVNEKQTAQEAINYLKKHGLTIHQCYEINGEPPQDVAAYLSGRIDACFPSDEDEVAEQVIDMVEMELAGNC